ncbi:MAG: hypothetical protein ACRCZ9_10310 [Fusobacteriaceae bacterium]
MEESSGIIVRENKVNMFGKNGRLVWHYFLYNKIIFEDSDGNRETIFVSKSDLQTKEKYLEILIEILEKNNIGRI